ncbi:hypothetical protein [Halomonas sp. BM-2019]|uniref:hypothetical protein n=1 Tax=Halomonas sp. BM-2019 TaxID=2811227 RepID=UPI001B3C33D7|nr:MAG: hypothetical protein J5F18_01675 [Halomonas sp. BM-2019]
MTRLDHPSLRQRPGGRWLAILLAVLLAMAALSSHAAPPTASGDCGITAEWMADEGQAGDHGDDAAHCATCIAPVPQRLLASGDPTPLTATPGKALVVHHPLPPRRPPRA